MKRITRINFNNVSFGRNVNNATSNVSKTLAADSKQRLWVDWDKRVVFVELKGGASRYFVPFEALTMIEYVEEEAPAKKQDRRATA